MLMKHFQRFYQVDLKVNIYLQRLTLFWQVKIMKNGTVMFSSKRCADLSEFFGGYEIIDYCFRKWPQMIDFSMFATSVSMYSGQSLIWIRTKVQMRYLSQNKYLYDIPPELIFGIVIKGFEKRVQVPSSLSIYAYGQYKFYPRSCKR